VTVAHAERVLDAGGRVTRVLQGPQTQELKQLRQQLAQLEATLNRVLEEQDEARHGGEPPRG